MVPCVGRHGVLYIISGVPALDQMNYIKVIVIWPAHPFTASIIERRLQAFLNRFRSVKTEQGGQAIIGYLDDRLADPEIKPMLLA